MYSILTKHKYVYKKLVIRREIQLSSQLTRNTFTSDASEEYQYIQKSKLPTMHFQPSLPRLPIPKLEDTCERYIDAQKPLLSEEQLRKTKSCVKEFLEKDGPKIQKILLQKDASNPHTSYISEPWFDMYLQDRKPLPINYNPFIIFVPESDSQYDTQLIKATNVIISSIRFMKSLRAGILKPEIYHMNSKKSDTELFYKITGLLPSRFSWYGAYLFNAFPLDMSQYPNLFNTTRIPQIGKDKIYQNEASKHIVVMQKGHFYAFDVLDKNNCIYQPKEIASCLKSIMEDDRPSNKYPVGILTTSERNEWSMTRSHLLKLGNQAILEKIDSAIFFLILDDEIFDNDYSKLIKTYLHDDGTNRWFDKSFSIIVKKDGYAGINFEHSWGDGVAVLRFIKDIKEDISKKPKFHPGDVPTLHKYNLEVEKINFILDEKIKNAIDKEKEKYNKWTTELHIDYLIYDGFGKDDCKKLKVSPDAIMQLAFQVAFYNLEGKMVPTYESCSTAAFRYGRTETIRPCTLETKAVCTALTQKNNESSKSELKEMIINCSNAHMKLTKNAAMGQGFDRHLFALKQICEQSGVLKPAIFEDPAYDVLNHNILSTSTLSDPAVLAGGFGPVVHDGFGIGYLIQGKKLGTIVSSYQGHSYNGTDFVRSLSYAFESIQKVLGNR